MAAGRSLQMPAVFLWQGRPSGLPLGRSSGHPVRAAAGDVYWAAAVAAAVAAAWQRQCECAAQVLPGRLIMVSFNQRLLEIISRSLCSFCSPCFIRPLGLDLNRTVAHSCFCVQWHGWRVRGMAGLAVVRDFCRCRSWRASWRAGGQRSVVF